MAIIVGNTSIQFGSFTLTEKADGFGFDGVINHQGLCDCRCFQGEVSGYSSGGITNNSPSETGADTIDKFPFSADAPATDVGNLSQPITQAGGQSSDVSGYISGGSIPPISDAIEKFPFSSDTDSTDVGELIEGRYGVSGTSSIVNGFGYAMGGRDPTNPTQFRNDIERFPFAADAPASDSGELSTPGALYAAGISALTHGYRAGGYSPPYVNNIDKYPFVSGGPATDVGDLIVAMNQNAGQSSLTTGYSSGGSCNPGFNPVNIIQKFPFSSDTNATDMADLTAAKSYVAGQSSTTSGYTSGGLGQIDVIEKFLFATETNSTDVGELSLARRGIAGQQV